MKNINYKYSAITLITALLITISISCEREFDSMIPADFPTNGDVFIDGFSTGLAYEAWGDVKAFDVDKEVSYKGEASMRFAVPDEGQTGGYAGGRFVTSIARDLSGYDALTFWAKATKAASIDIIGFGNNAEGSKYRASLNGVKVNTNWKKFIIPIPDAAKLKRETGMLYYTETPEDGSGYTFWIDEVKFEKLGTIAHQKPAIFNGENQVNKTFNSIKIPTVGLSYVANLPNGVNQVVDVAPSYFTFSTSDNAVASVDETGMVSVLSAGTAVISASMADVEAEGSLTVESSGDFVHAPTPTVNADSVISIFSNTYTNVPVEYYNGYWQPYQTTLSADFTIDGNDVLNYTNFNFVGIQFTAPTINASDMTHLHLDVFIPNEVNPGDKLQIRAVDLGADGSFDDPNPTVSETLEGSSLVAKSWISVDIDLSTLASKNNLAQIIFDNLGSSLSNFYVDNIYLYNSGESAGDSDPKEAAPSPTIAEADVISIFSDAYTNLEGTDYPVWDFQTTILSNVSIANNQTLKLQVMNYQGVQLATPVDLTTMTHLHIDVWSPNFEKFSVKLVDFGPDNNFGGGDDTNSQIDYPSPNQGEWVSYDIPLTDFTGLGSVKHIAQLIIECLPTSATTLFVDNIYFYKKPGGGDTGPTSAAPTPTVNAADVVSIYSDAYDDIAFDNFDAGWCGGAAVIPVTINGNNTLKKNAGVDCQGIDFSSYRQDLSAYNYIHFDFYTDDADLTGAVFNVKLVDFAGGGAEASNLQININTGTNPAIVSGSWVSVDVDISSLGGVVAGSLTRSDVAQIGITTANLTNVWYDNIYFYKDGGGSSVTEPIVSAPAPNARDAADVISVFSNTYTNIAGTNFNPDWGQSTEVTTVDIAGNSTLKYSTFNFQGIELGSTQDLSEMEYLHVDMWTADATVVQVTPVNNSGSPAEHLVSLSPVTSGQWKSYDIPLTSFTSSGMSLNGVFQLKFDGQAGNTPSTIYLDNIYFYKSSGGGGGGETGPTAAAPTPPARNAENVVSIFSDAYTNITIDNFDAGWCGGAATTQVAVAGNNTLKKNAGIECHGIDFSSNRLDLSSFTHIHFDFYTDDENLVGDVFNVKLVDFAGGNGEASALEVNINTGTTPAIVAGTWVSVDIDISSLGGVVTGSLTRSDVAQIGITTANLTNVWYDNIYLYK